jgi:uncharacterized protein YraI
MRYQPFFASLLLFLSMLACNFPSAAAVTPTATTLLSTNTPAQPSFTPVPSNTALPAASALPTITNTPTVPVASPKDVAVNCRFGPGTAWVAISALNIGQASQIVGKSSDGSWWYIVDPFNSSRNCWVSASVTNASGNLAPIPVVEIPKASVTNVSVKVDPGTIVVAGCTGPLLPIKLTGTIEVNGPTTVKWYFETQQGGAFATQTTDFQTFGSKDVTAEYSPPLTAGNYWVRLIVTSPNTIQSEVKYTIQC